MKRSLALLLALAVFIAGCTAELRGKPLAGILEQPTEKDPCFGISCGKNAICKDGACSCLESYKTCNKQAPSPKNICVGDKGCCSNSDCNKYEVCVSGSCTFSCDKTTCDSNKICYESTKGCYCPDGYKWCDTQVQCIPSSACCGKFDCGRNQACTRTIDSARVCLIGNEKICRYIAATSRDFTMDGKTHTVAADKFFYGKYASFVIDGDEYNLTPGSNVTLGEQTLQLEQLKTIVGACQDKAVDTEEQE